MGQWQANADKLLRPTALVVPLGLLWAAALVAGAFGVFQLVSDLTIYDKGAYMEVTLNADKIPTMGANGFFIRREILNKLDFKEYLFDVDMVYALIKKGYNKFAKVKLGIVHLFAADIRTFILKQARRSRDWLYFKEKRIYPWRGVSKTGILKFIFGTFLILPRVFETIRGYINVRDPAWLFHLPACWLTLLIYFIIVIKHLCGKIITR